MKITVVDYEAGNLRSIETALQRLDVPYEISSDPDQIRKAVKIIFPGVGHAGHAMQTLQAKGIDSALSEAYKAGTPIFGICLGCQIILSSSEEAAGSCLGLIPGGAMEFPENMGLKVPHMGWNEVQHDESHWLFEGIPSGVSFYFVHSYYPKLEENDEIASSEYGFRFSAAMERNSLVAAQFHPEKSGEYGIRMLSNFCFRPV